MTNLRQAAQQALEALEKVKTDADKQPPVYPWDIWRMWVDRAITALRAALAEPEQEPVAWMYQDKSTHEVKFQKHMRGFVDHGATYETPLYTAPTPRKPLTDEEIELLAVKHAPPIDPAFAQHDDFIEFARAIERAHGIGGEA
jgi:hypothetical protein